MVVSQLTESTWLKSLCVSYRHFLEIPCLMQTCLFTHQTVQGSNKAFTCVRSLDIAKAPQVCRWYQSHGRKQRGTKEPLDGDESKKAGLKPNIQNTKIMASSLITLWQIDGKKMEIVGDFIFLGSKITIDGDCNHEIKRCLLLGKKAMTNLHSVLKSRDITLSKRAI